MRISMVMIAIGACAACSSGGQHTRLRNGHRRKAAAPVALYRTPDWAAAACATMAELSGACPTAIPATPKRGWVLTFAGPRPNRRVASWQLQSGVERGGFNERVHRPPVYSNVVALGGAFMRLDRRAFPAESAPVARIRDGMANGDRRRPVRLGSRSWGGHRGELSLTPSIYAADGPLTDVTLFRWHDATGDHAVGVNVWEPITRSVQTLHAIVDRLAAVSPPPPRPARIGAAHGMPVVRAPLWVADLCDASRVARPACPRVVPMAGVDGADVSIQPLPPWPRQGRVKTSWMSITWSGPGVHVARDVHPPAFGHFEVTAGHVRHSAHDTRRIPLARIKIPTGYITTHPIALGRRRWTAHAGKLIFGDCFANHLCYRWPGPAGTYQVDLHAWYPLVQTVAVLHAMVASTPAASATR
jgi:hypothetical protein